MPLLIQLIHLCHHRHRELLRNLLRAKTLIEYAQVLENLSELLERHVLGCAWIRKSTRKALVEFLHNSDASFQIKIDFLLVHLLSAEVSCCE